MSKLIIDEQLIEDELEERGIMSSACEDYDKALEQLQKHYDFELTDDWNDNAEFFIYGETTADGYEVFIATSDTRNNPSIGEDVYYYDHDLSERLEDAMYSCYGNIFVDDLGAGYIEDAIDNVYNSFIDDIREDIENELVEKGYTYEEEE